jgi:VIT1/CCC1 family predicted Fe2+/Mn2+ transporter
MTTRLTKLSYGSTAAIVTSMGLIGGLGGGVASRATVTASLLVIAIADNLTDSLAIHVYQESENLESNQAFLSTVANFFARLLAASSFVLIVLFVPEPVVLVTGLGWGMALLAVLTFFVARARGVSPVVEVVKHLAMAVVVIAVSKAIGAFILAHVS